MQDTRSPPAERQQMHHGPDIADSAVPLACHVLLLRALSLQQLFGAARACPASHSSPPQDGPAAGQPRSGPAAPQQPAQEAASSSAPEQEAGRERPEAVSSSQSPQSGTAGAGHSSTSVPTWGGADEGEPGAQVNPAARAGPSLAEQAGTAAERLRQQEAGPLMQAVPLLTRYVVGCLASTSLECQQVTGCAPCCQAPALCSIHPVAAASRSHFLPGLPAQGISGEAKGMPRRGSAWAVTVRGSFQAGPA